MKKVDVDPLLEKTDKKFPTDEEYDAFVKEYLELERKKITNPLEYFDDSISSVAGAIVLPFAIIGAIINNVVDADWGTTALIIGFIPAGLVSLLFVLSGIIGVYNYVCENGIGHSIKIFLAIISGLVSIANLVIMFEIISNSKRSWTLYIFAYSIIILILFRKKIKEILT